MGAALLAPVLRGVFNLPEMQVHLFMLYFACLSAITPPVAVANFAAGAIAGVNPMALGPYAVKLAIGGFILPFYFLFNPGLNMEGGPLYITGVHRVRRGDGHLRLVRDAGLSSACGRSPWPLRLVLIRLRGRHGVAALRHHARRDPARRVSTGIRPAPTHPDEGRRVRLTGLRRPNV